jgi:GntR family transcriptional regulator
MSTQDHWNDDQPIYRQLRDKVIALIMEGVFAEGEAVPSVRQISVDYSINHLTVSKAYQQLVDEDLLFKKRGVGMFVSNGAQKKLLAKERNKFLQQELPVMIRRMSQLGITKEEIVDILENNNKDNS